jgi:SOS response regulatory protein OraA/RecX
VPAETVVELVSALRQNLAGAGVELQTIETALAQGNEEALRAAVARLRGQLEELSTKAALALEANRG